MWEVWRHGGTRRHQWRLVLRTDDEGKARQRYAKAAGELRQGGVRLYRLAEGGEREMVQGVWAPCLRTRW